MVTVHVRPEDLSRFMADNRDELLQNYMLLAEDTSDDFQIYLSMDMKSASLTIWLDNEVVWEEKIDISQNLDFSGALMEAYKRRLLLYFDKDHIGADDDLPFDDKDGQPFSAEEQDRLRDIEAAAEDFLSVLIEVSPEKAGLNKDDVDDLTYRVEKTLYDEYGIACWHPTQVGDSVVSFPFGEDSDSDFDPFEDSMVGMV